MMETTAPARPNAALRRLVWVGAIALLALPAVAMLFTARVDWGVEDFVAGGVLLLGTAFVLDRVLGSGWNWRAIALAAAAALLLLAFVWAELAVGVVGSLWAGS